MELLSLLALIPILFSAASVSAHEVYEVDEHGHERKIRHSHDRDVDAPYQYRYPTRSIHIRNRNIRIRREFRWDQSDKSRFNYCINLDSLGFVCNNHTIYH